MYSAGEIRSANILGVLAAKRPANEMLTSLKIHKTYLFNAQFQQTFCDVFRKKVIAVKWYTCWL